MISQLQIFQQDSPFIILNVIYSIANHLNQNNQNTLKVNMTHLSYKKIFKLSKGFFGRRKNCIRIAFNAVERALLTAYKERRLRRRTLRRNWISTINAAVREHQVPYSRFIYGLNNSNINLDRKILAELSVNEPYSFKAIIDEVKLQTQIGREARTKDVNAYERAVLDGTIFPVGTVPPSIEEIKEKMKEKELDLLKDLKLPYNKLEKPTEEEFEKLRMWRHWESDWEDDRHYE